MCTTAGTCGIDAPLNSALHIPGCTTYRSTASNASTATCSTNGNTPACGPQTTGRAQALRIWQHRHNHHRFHTAIGGLPEGRDDSLSFYKNQAATSRPSGRNRTSCVQPKLSWYAVQSPLHVWVGPAQLRNASIGKIPISGVSIHFPHGVVTLESIYNHDHATFSSWAQS